MNARNNTLSLLLLAAGALAGAGCERNEMHQQARVDPLEESRFYADGRASRVPPAGTVARDHLRLDDAYFTGTVGGEPVDAFPEPVTRFTLERGRERYDIYCSVCHGYLGDANGMVVQRGFTRPPTFIKNKPEAEMSAREKYLQTAPPGHIYQVITNGWGAMYSYNDRIAPKDRWAIAAYIKALQLAAHYPVAQLPAEERAELAALDQKQQAAGHAAEGAAPAHAPATEPSPEPQSQPTTPQQKSH